MPAVARKGAYAVKLVGVCAKKSGDYVSPTLRALSDLSEFLGSGHAIIAGDFNQSAALKRPEGRRFSNTVDQLSALGLRSAWRLQHIEEFGCESQGTFFRHRKQEQPFHIDYAFATRALNTENVQLGLFADYVANGLSDHVPLVLDVALST